MRNIVLLSIDNLRYDCIGYQPDKKELKKYDSLRLLETPNLDELSEESICYTQCISTNTYTTSAHASVLTGLYPPRHGVRTFFDTKLNRDVYTLAEVLKVYGYETVFSTDVIELFDPLDISRGFDHIFFLDDHNLFRFLAEKRDEKVFLFMHLFDVHEPYLFSKYEVRQGCNNDYYQEMTRLHRLFGIPFDPSNASRPFKLWGDFWDHMGKRHIEYALPLFVKGVSKFDQGRFRWIRSELEKTVLMDDTVLILFSDHGEGKCYQRNPSHFLHSGELFDNVIRVPLIIRMRDLNPGIQDDLVSLADIFPTLFHLATDLKAEDILPYDLNGIDLLNGGKRETAYSEVWTCKTPVIDLDGEKHERFVGDFQATVPNSLLQRGIRTKDRKIVIRGRSDTPVDSALFSLPHEAFLRKIYFSMFNRELDREGFPYFLEALDKKRITKEEVYRHFLYSDEYMKQKNKPALMVYDLKDDPYENNPFVFSAEVFSRRRKSAGEGGELSDIFPELRGMDLIRRSLEGINAEMVNTIIEQRLRLADMDDIDSFIDIIKDIEARAVDSEKAFQEKPVL
jgi:arylsulfatase A-like enzyme